MKYTVVKSEKQKSLSELPTGSTFVFTARPGVGVLSHVYIRGQQASVNTIYVTSLSMGQVDMMNQAMAVTEVRQKTAVQFEEV